MDGDLLKPGWCVLGSKRFGPSEEIPIEVFGQSTDCLCGLCDVVLFP